MDDGERRSLTLLHGSWMDPPSSSFMLVRLLFGPSVRRMVHTKEQPFTSCTPELFLALLHDWLALAGPVRACLLSVYGHVEGSFAGLWEAKQTMVKKKSHGPQKRVQSV